MMLQTSELSDTLKELERKLKLLKLEYDKYFLGNRPNEPAMNRGEVQKIVTMMSQNPIRNTAERFRFQSINARFQAFKRQWDTILRQIEDGTYHRHKFKANLHERARGIEPDEKPKARRSAPKETRGDRMGRIFGAYVEAAQSCGQDTSKLSQKKLEKVIAKQEAALRKKLGCDNVDFRVVVKDGKVKLKAAAAK